MSVSTEEEGVASIKTGVVDALQLICNLLSHDPEEKLLPLAMERDIGIIVRTPLAFGLLTGKYQVGHQFPHGDFRRGMPADRLEQEIPRVEKLRFLVKDQVKSLAQAAIASVLSNPAVSVAIPGAKTTGHVEDNLAAANVAPLSAEDLKQVDDLYARGFAD